MTVKALVARHGPGVAPLATHVACLQRDDVTKDGAAGQLFNAERDEANGRQLADRCTDDRHHFRFIISPEALAEMADLAAFTRDLMHTPSRTSAHGATEWRLNNITPSTRTSPCPFAGERTTFGPVDLPRLLREWLQLRVQAVVTSELESPADMEIRRGFQAQVDTTLWMPLDVT